MHPRSNASGFTVIELLAVVSLLSLAMVLGATRLGRATDEARFSRALADVLELDARARLLARSGGAVSLQVGDDRARLVLSRARGGALLGSTTLPRDVTVRLTDPATGKMLAEVRFDRAGRSPDYDVEVALEERRVRRSVAGLSGLVARAGAER
ncbi:MAG: prepilin-type N-terminal cleavage/methylation domain-containing protein [Planctomycetes bacterium]|nr:prepilin-type N-terminal cleavage/methylation domain-containing protein [Planctomycetota bacterium]